MARLSPRRCAALALCALALALARPAAAVSASAARAQTNFTLVAQTPLASDPALSAGRRCAASITHLRVGTYRNVDPENAAAETDAVLYGDLLVNGGACNSTGTAVSATVFKDVAQSPVGTAVEVAEMFFLRGTDNSARRCVGYDADLPAFYYFTNDMPFFRARLEDERLVPRGSDALAAANKSRVYMMSRQYSRRDGAVVDDVVCTYIEKEVANATKEGGGTAEATVEDNGGSACFPGSAVVRVATALGEGRRRRFDERTVEELRIGDVVSFGYGGGSVVGERVSDVFFFSHRDPRVLAEFVVLAAAPRGGQACSTMQCAADAPATLTVSPGHYVLTRPRGLVVARDIRPGEDALVREDGSSATVVGVRRVAARGLFAPHTLRGSLVVDGFVVSAYTEAVPPAVAHAVLAPLRLVYMVLGVAVEGVLDQNGGAGVLGWPRLVRPAAGKLYSHCRRASWGIVGRLVEMVVCPFLVIPTESR